MRTSLLASTLILAGFAVSSSCPAQTDVAQFAAIDIYLHSQQPVAAWQFRLASRRGVMKVVGVERGDSAAFPRAPYYDREAVRLGTADRIVVADYSLANNARLPSGRTRLATVHLMLSAAGHQDLNLDLVTATTRGGRRAEAQISFELPTGDNP